MGIQWPPNGLPNAQALRKSCMNYSVESPSFASPLHSPPHAYLSPTPPPIHSFMTAFPSRSLPSPLKPSTCTVCLPLHPPSSCPPSPSCSQPLKPSTCIMSRFLPGCDAIMHEFSCRNLCSQVFKPGSSSLMLCGSCKQNNTLLEKMR